MVSAWLSISVGHGATWTSTSFVFFCLTLLIKWRFLVTTFDIAITLDNGQTTSPLWSNVIALASSFEELLDLEALCWFTVVALHPFRGNETEPLGAVDWDARCIPLITAATTLSSALDSPLLDELVALDIVCVVSLASTLLTLALFTFEILSFCFDENPFWVS